MPIEDSASGKALNQTSKALMGLREMVLGGSFPPGERLFEVPLAVQLNLSRTPVRAALSQLEQEGLLERAQGGGFVVRSFSIQEVLDSIELRGMLEGVAARLAAERGVEERDLEVIRKTLDQLDLTLTLDPAEIQFERYVELNAKFHEQLAILCGSKVFQSEIDRAGRLPFASPSAFLQEQSDVIAFRRSLSSAQDQHRAIVEAIENREGARAEALAREHARLARRNLENVMSRDRSLISRVPALALVSA